MAQQTAVEWLQAEFNKWAEGRVFIPQDILERAKQMEKEQMIELTQTLTSTPSDISRDTATFIVENFINH